MKSLKGWRIVTKSYPRLVAPGLCEGYLYRDPADRMIRLVNTEKKGDPETIVGGGDRYLDSFILVPKHLLVTLLDITNFEQEWGSLRERLQCSMAANSVEKLFFPNGFQHYREPPEYINELRLAYYIAGEELHHIHKETGIYDEGWMHVLAIAAFSRGCTGVLKPYSYPTLFLIFMYQIFDAETDDDFARILSVARLPEKGEKMNIPHWKAGLEHEFAA